MTVIALWCTAVCYADNTQEELEDWYDDFTIEELLARGIPGETVPTDEELTRCRKMEWRSFEFLNNKTSFTEKDTLLIEEKVRNYIVNYALSKKRILKDSERVKVWDKAYIDSLKKTGINIDGHVHTTADKPPYCDLNRHFAKHFRYPKEAWKKEKCRWATIEGIVLKDGSMVGIKVTSTEDPELVAELKRVTELIHWEPAKNGGPRTGKPFSQNLNCYRSFYVNLTPSSSHADNSPYAAFIPATGTSTVPYGLESV
ncbi:MAG: hypothetical protein HDS68_06945, partial [Bacteroidales bacterium]|nr:hypothetical protein [Bacteroidales bacterium]